MLFGCRAFQHEPKVKGYFLLPYENILHNCEIFFPSSEVYIVSKLLASLPLRIATQKSQKP